MPPSALRVWFKACRADNRVVKSAPAAQPNRFRRGLRAIATNPVFPAVPPFTRRVHVRRRSLLAGPVFRVSGVACGENDSAAAPAGHDFHSGAPLAVEPHSGRAALVLHRADCLSVVAVHAFVGAPEPGVPAGDWVQHWGEAKHCRQEQGAPLCRRASRCGKVPGMDHRRFWPAPHHYP